MKEHEQYLLDVMQGRRPFKNVEPKPGEGKYYYLDPNQKYDWFTPSRPDQRTYVPSEDSPNPYTQPRQPAAQQFQQPFQPQQSFHPQQPQIQGYASLSGSIPNASAGGIQPVKYTEQNMKKPSPAMASLKPFLQDKEAISEHPYLDIEGNITSGYGHMDKNLNSFARHPWYNQTTQKPATMEEIQKYYNTLKAAPYGQNYGAKSFKQQTPLRLSRSYAEQLLDHDIAIREEELHQTHPNFKYMSPEMQVAIAEPNYHVGTLKWPKLKEAIQNKDKEAICTNIHRKETDNKGNFIKGFQERNQWAYDMCQKGYFIK